MKTQLNTYIAVFDMINKEGTPNRRTYQVTADSLTEAKEKFAEAIEDICTVRKCTYENLEINQLHNIPTLDL